MKKLIILLLISLIIVFTGSLYTIKGLYSKLNTFNEITKIQDKFDLLADDAIFSQKKVKREVIQDDIATGLASIHDFPSLGIKVYSDDPYSQSFKKTSQFIVKNGNILIDSFSPTQYIEIIAKDPNVDIKDIFEEKYFKQYGTGCKIYMITGNAIYFTGRYSNSIIVYAVSPDSVVMEERCYIGKVPYERYNQIWYNTKTPDRYYIVNLYVGCAPGKCNVFNQIELY